MFPPVTTISFTQPIVLDVTIYYDSSRVVSVTGLPPGLSFGTDVDGSTSPFFPYGAWVNGGSIPNVTPAVGCVYVHGAPSAWQAAQVGGDTGVYIIQVEYDARIVQTDPDVSGFGVPNGTWLSAVNPSFGGGTITINVPIDTDPITDLAVPILVGAASAHVNTAETYTATAGMTTYEWAVVGGTIQSGQGTDEVSVLWDGGSVDGTVTVEVGGGDGCTKSQSLDVMVVGVGIHEAHGLNTRVYPNPSEGVFNIETESVGQAQISVIDLSGKLIRSEQFRSPRHTTDLSELEPGVYFLTIETERGRSVNKVIIK